MTADETHHADMKRLDSLLRTGSLNFCAPDANLTEVLESFVEATEYGQEMVTPATTEWRTDEPPKDGTPILAVFETITYPIVVTRVNYAGIECWSSPYTGALIREDPDLYALINHPEGREWV